MRGADPYQPLANSRGGINGGAERAGRLAAAPAAFGIRLLAFFFRGLFSIFHLFPVQVP